MGFRFLKCSRFLISVRRIDGNANQWFSRFGRFCIRSRVKWFSAEAGKVNLVGDTRNATSKEAIRPCTNDGDGSNA